MISNKPHLLILILAFFGLGPFIYEPLGIRLEHAGVICVCLISLLGYGWNIDALKSGLLLGASFIAIGYFCGFFMFSTFNDLGAYKELFNSLKFPILMISLIQVFISYGVYGARVVILPMCSLYVVALMINFLLQIWSSISDISGFLGYFVTTDGNSVWANSYALGRYLGVFTQPLSLGFASLLGLIALSIIISFKGFRVKYYLLILCVIVSGAMSGSKIAIFGTIIASCILFIGNIRQALATMLLSIVIIGVIVLYVNCVPDSYLGRVGVDFSIEGLTGGRFGSDASLGELFLYIKMNGPIAGVGAGTIRNMEMAFDNEILLAWASGGVLALIGVFLIYAALFAVALRLKSLRSKYARHGLCLFVCVIVAGIGGPVISGNHFIFILSALVSWLWVESKKNHSNENRHYSSRIG